MDTATSAEGWTEPAAAPASAAPGRAGSRGGNRGGSRAGGRIGGQFLRYLVTGGFAAAIDLGGFLALMAAGLGLFPAAALSFLVAASLNYFLAARFVFAEPASVRRFLAFMAVLCTGLVFNAGVTTLAGGFVPAWLAKLAGIGVAFCFNFLVNALVVFRPRPR